MPSRVSLRDVTSMSDTSPGTEDSARQEARRAISSTILRMAAAAGAEVRERPPYPGAAWTVPQPAPADGIRFASFLRDAAIAAVRDHIREARREGMTWVQLGEVLGLREAAEERGAWIADLAFDYAVDAAHARPFEVLSFGWRCLACGGLVSDRGPGNGSPEDNEPGHADGCERMARLVAEHDARWGDE